MDIPIRPGRPVMGIGSNVVDVIHRVNRIARPEEKVYIVPDVDGRVVTEAIGGVTLNHLAWARRLGVRSGLFGFQGDDRFGTMIRAEMDRHGIGRDRVVVRPGESSSFSIIFVDPEAERSITMARALTANTTPLDIANTFAEAIRDAGVVTTEVSQLPLDTVIAVLRTAREAGVPTVLDVDVPPSFAVEVARLGTRTDLEEALGLADVIKPAKAAAQELTGLADPAERASAVFRMYGPKLVAVTDGRNGSVLTTGEEVVLIPACPVQAVDSTGAGDAFLGGLIAGIVHHLPLRDAGALANACGAACCTVVGAFPIPGRSEEDIRRVYAGAAVPQAEPATPSKAATSPGRAGVESVRAEARALACVAEGLEPAVLDRAVRLVLDAEARGGRVHVTGVGKPRHVAHKMAATLQSTGTAAYFLDPTDAVHGDSGQAKAGDVVIAVSHSGKTRELLDAVRLLKRNGASVVGIAGNRASDLARESDVFLCVPVPSEAGPLGLAPTSSTTCQLAVGDGLAVALQAARGFTSADFHRYHPGGSLGKRLEQG